MHEVLVGNKEFPLLVFPIRLHQHHTTPLVSVPPQLGKVIILPLLQLIIVLWGWRNSHRGKLSLHLSQLLFFCCHGQRVTIDSLDDLHWLESADYIIHLFHVLVVLFHLLEIVIPDGRGVFHQSLHSLFVLVLAVVVIKCSVFLRGLLGTWKL